MACHGPLDGWLSRERGGPGKRPVTFRFRDAFHDVPISVPCGRCNGCLLDRARSWAIRAVHEASLWPCNSFVTLTYRDGEVPRLRRLDNGGTPEYELTLRKVDFQLFMKRLRKWHFERWSGTREAYRGVRFLQAGEYGSLGRPHHHALLFNCDFPDREVFRRTASQEVIYRSGELEKLWPFGFSSIGEVTFESAAYVARYTVKKFAAVVRDEVSRGESGVRENRRVPEYLTMSLKPGLGDGWLRRYMGDVYPDDEVVLRGGRKYRPPRFYDERLRKLDEAQLREVKARRLAEVNEADQCGSRLVVKAEISRRLLKDRLRRDL